MQCHQLFGELWRNLLDSADSNMDGEVTVDEWVKCERTLSVDGGTVHSIEVFMPLKNLKYTQQ